jgi:hypothetical protein
MRTADAAPETKTDPRFMAQCQDGWVDGWKTAVSVGKQCYAFQHFHRFVALLLWNLSEVEWV